MGSGEPTLYCLYANLCLLGSSTVRIPFKTRYVDTYGMARAIQKRELVENSRLVPVHRKTEVFLTENRDLTSERSDPYLIEQELVSVKS